MTTPYKLMQLSSAPSLISSPKTSKSLLCIGIVLLLTGCQSSVDKQQEMPSTSSTPTVSSDQLGGEIQTSGLTPELLYDLLVASIAAQRQQLDIALESLSRAAYQSRDRRLVSEAIQLAMDNREYQQAAELAQLLNNIEPENHHGILALADAHFNLGETDIALKLLADLVRVQTIEQTNVMRDAADVLSNQNKDTILTDFLGFASGESDTIGFEMTVALLASKLKETAQILLSLDQVLALSPDWEIPAIMKLSHLSSHNLESTEPFSKSHLLDYPNHHRFRLQYARFLIQQDNPDDALTQLLIILKTNPKSAQALYTAGVIYLQKDMLDEAKRLLTRYLEIDSRNDQIRIYLADIELDQKNYSTATKFLHGVSSPQHYVEAQIKLARVISERTGVEAGLQHLQRVEVASEDEEARLILEQEILLRDNDMIERAKQILDDGLKRFPDNPDLLYNRGLLTAQLGMIELHEADMRKLITLQPDNAHAYNALGYTLADKTDRLDEALNLISKANELLPNNAFILDSMGWIHFRLGNNEQALKYLNEALVEQQDAEIAAHLGEVLWVTGRHDEAIIIWKQGGEWGPGNAVLKDTIERMSAQQQSTHQNINLTWPASSLA